jgi:putative tricarboxylic transport membrane protein
VPDLVVALLWAAFGVIVFIASWRMERLEKLGIDRWSAPGLTPGVVGALIVVLALVLAWKAYRPGDIDAAEPDTEKSSVDGADDAGLSAATTRRTLLAAALCVLFAGITLGHGLPFVVEGALFILAFTAAFSWRAWRDEGRIGRGLLQTAAVAVAASVTISWLFESVFLVRLP